MKLTFKFPQIYASSLLTMLLLFSNTLYAVTNEADLYPFESQEMAQRFATLSYETRCVVCQNQNLAESTAPLAADLRGKIYQLLLQNKSDNEIKSYLVKRYGNFILFKPPFNRVTFALWSFPLIGIMMIFLLLWQITR